MNKKEIILMLIIIIALIISIGDTYYKTIIIKSFEVINIEPVADDQATQ